MCRLVGNFLWMEFWTFYVFSILILFIYLDILRYIYQHCFLFLQAYKKVLPEQNRVQFSEFLVEAVDWTRFIYTGWFNSKMKVLILSLRFQFFKGLISFFRLRPFKGLLFYIVLFHSLVKCYMSCFKKYIHLF